MERVAKLLDDEAERFRRAAGRRRTRPRRAPRRGGARWRGRRASARSAGRPRRRCRRGARDGAAEPKRPAWRALGSRGWPTGWRARPSRRARRAGRLDPPLVDEPAALIAGGRRAAAAVRRAHRGRAGRGHRQRQVLAGQRAGRGAAVSQVGVRRPTTGVAHAVRLGRATPPARCWTGCRSRAGTPPADRRGDAGPTGWCCSTCPTSTRSTVAHRLEVDRLVELVDLLVWVLDPQKYADAALHDRYLRPLAGHGDVTLVVLNQADRLAAGRARRRAWPTCAGCSPTTGCRDVPVLAVSALTGDGLDALRRAGRPGRGPARIGAAAAADLGRTAAALRAGLAGGRRPARGIRRQRPRDALVDALAAAAGVTRSPPRSTGRTGQGRRGHRAGRSPAGCAGCGRTRCAGCGCRRTPSEADSRHRAARAVRRVQRARVDSALRELTDGATDGLPDRGRGVVRRRRPARPRTCPTCWTGRSPAPTSGVAAGRAGGCWSAFLQALLAVATVAGLVWAAGAARADWLQLPEPPLPHVGRVPLPTLLLIGGRWPGCCWRCWPAGWPRSVAGAAGGPPAGCAAGSPRSPTIWWSPRSASSCQPTTPSARPCPASAHRTDPSSPSPNPHFGAKVH